MKWTRVILAGKRDSRRHSTTSFSESVVVAGTSYQMCNRRFSILQPGEVLSSFNNDKSANFSGEKKCNEEFQGVYILRIREKTLNQISYS